MRRPSVTVDGSFSDNIRIQKTGNSEQMITTARAPLHPNTRLRSVLPFTSDLPALLGQRRLEELDEDDVDDGRADEHQHRGCRAEAQVWSVEQRVIAEDRHGLDAAHLRRAGDDE